MSRLKIATTFAACRAENHMDGSPHSYDTRDPSSAGRLLVSNLITALVLLAMVGCGGDGPPKGEPSESKATEQVSITESDLSDTARAGEKLFNANCSVCHGMGAAGTNQGPPLVDRIYHPGHHPDFSIRNAVRQGVQAAPLGFRRYGSLS